MLPLVISYRIREAGNKTRVTLLQHFHTQEVSKEISDTFPSFQRYTSEPVFEEAALIDNLNNAGPWGPHRDSNDGPQKIRRYPDPGGLSGGAPGHVHAIGFNDNRQMRRLPDTVLSNILDWGNRRDYPDRDGRCTSCLPSTRKDGGKNRSPGDKFTQICLLCLVIVMESHKKSKTLPLLSVT
jgi:hypothetical protein